NGNGNGNGNGNILATAAAPDGAAVLRVSGSPLGRTSMSVLAAVAHPCATCPGYPEHGVLREMWGQGFYRLGGEAASCGVAGWLIEQAGLQHWAALWRAGRYPWSRPSNAAPPASKPPTERDGSTDRQGAAPNEAAPSKHPKTRCSGCVLAAAHGCAAVARFAHGCAPERPGHTRCVAALSEADHAIAQLWQPSSGQAERGRLRLALPQQSWAD